MPTLEPDFTMELTAPTPVGERMYRVVMRSRGIPFAKAILVRDVRECSWATVCDYLADDEYDTAEVYRQEIDGQPDTIVLQYNNRGVE